VLHYYRPVSPTSWKIARLLVIAFSLATIPLVYLLGKELYSARAGLIAALLFAIAPGAVYYGRAIVPESDMLFFGCAALLFAAAGKGDPLAHPRLTVIGSFAPVPRDVLAAANPHMLVVAEVFDKADQGLGAAGMPAEPHMQSDRHHAWPVGAFLVQHVEAVTQIGEEILAWSEHAAAEFDVVGRQRIGHHQMRLAGSHDPIGQLIGIAVGVVEEAAFLDQ